MVRWQLGTADRPAVIAHRGASMRALENTIPALEQALALGVDAAEIDVRLSLDRVPMVFHDPDLLRLAGRPEEIDELSCAALQAIPLRSEGDAASYTMPTLAQVLACCRDRLPLDIELKSLDDALVPAVLREVRAAGMMAQVAFSSFNPSFLRRIVADAPEAWIGYLIALEEQLGEVLASPYPGAFIPKWALDADEVIQPLHAAGKQIMVWTVNTPEEIFKTIGLGVEGICSNTPERVQQALAARAGG